MIFAGRGGVVLDQPQQGRKCCGWSRAGRDTAALYSNSDTTPVQPALDFAGRPPEKQRQVPPAHPNFYADWRARHGFAAALRESGTAPPEKLLQAVWHHQRLCRDRLRLLDGRSVRILHPGFWNYEAGPDFRGAVVQIDDGPPLTGDVEIDLHSSNWHGHGHDHNPNFQNVALHVVWEGDARNPAPVLELKRFLDAPLDDLAVWLGGDLAQSFPEALAGQCAAPLRELPRARLTTLLDQAALVRFQRKAADLQARARQCGWEQTLWEALLRALGYKQNVWPMQRLGELRPRLAAKKIFPLHGQARLLGVSGLLPDELTRAQKNTDDYLRRVWDYWWRERDEFRDCQLPRALWRFNGLRPANHPQRRLALAAHWWADDTLPARLEQWFLDDRPDAALVESLLEVLQVNNDEFWSWHWTLRSKRAAKPQPLLGATRATDLAVNVVLPWFWVRAGEGKNAALQARAEQRYLAWPAAEDNAVLRLARQRLLGGTRLPLTAATQQGLLQIVRDFCQHSNALCTECRFPELVRHWQITGA